MRVRVLREIKNQAGTEPENQSNEYESKKWMIESFVGAFY
jgi:hypothetical protein